jgi:hypothetical protein
VVVVWLKASFFSNQNFTVGKLKFYEKIEFLSFKSPGKYSEQIGNPKQNPGNPNIKLSKSKELKTAVFVWIFQILSKIREI